MDTRWSLFITIQFSLLLFGLTSSPPTFCHENEISALLEFKERFFNKTQYSCSPYSTYNAYRKIEPWRMEVEFRNCCAWDGVECDVHNGHVIAIDLGDSCLSGTISSNTTLFHLVHLQRLNLSHNRLIGQVPPQILRLTNLLSLDLSYNDELELKKPNLLDLAQNLTKLETLNLNWVNISAPVPNILANLSSLRSLQLDGCNLRGEFPPNIFKMPKLEFLDLSDSTQLSGHLPEFCWRSPLKSLRISNTNFSGQLPSSLGKLASLNELDLGYNNFTHQVPSSLGNLTQLRKLSISTLLMGEIPLWIRDLTQLLELSLFDNQMTGVIPSWIGQLSNLEVIDLGFNKLKGEIPSSLGNLTQLRGLYIGNNQLIGEIPSTFVNLTQLFYLDLHLNQLSGQIFPYLTKLIHLEIIDLSFNNFSGQIPRSIIELKNLIILDLYSNNLNGIVHWSMFVKLKRLFILHLSFNNLSLVDELNSTNANLINLGIVGLASCNLSLFPSFLQRQDGLLWVDLSYNNIYGEIPEWFLNMNIESLISLNLSRNLLTSSPHKQVNFRWKVLYVMDLTDNNLEGSLPIPPASIKYYLVSKNKLYGKLPPQICELSNVNGIDLDENDLMGILPQCLSNLSDTLSFLSLRGNNFYGEIPSLLPNKECKLRMLDLSGNHFQGSLPRSLSKCSELEFLNLGSNQIKDVFPSWLGSLGKLRVLILHSNEFHGPVGEPKFSNDFASLQIIDLSINNFSSCLPSKYFECWKAMKFPSLYQENYMGRYVESGLFGVSFNWKYDYSMTIISKGIKRAYPKIHKNLAFIDLSMNNFTCEIPGTIRSLVEVQFLNISNNKLIGTIPSFLKDLTELEALDLSRNKLYGKIPQELEQLNFLSIFNVSYNNLDGRIPQGRQFDTFSNDSYFGNEELCGLPLPKKCDNDEKLLQPQPQSKDEGEESMEIEWKVVLMGYGSGLVIGAIIGWSFAIRPPSWILKYFGRRAYYIR